jgi:hypothetical protein
LIAADSVDRGVVARHAEGAEDQRLARVELKGANVVSKRCEINAGAAEMRKSF